MIFIAGILTGIAGTIALLGAVLEHEHADEPGTGESSGIASA